MRRRRIKAYVQNLKIERGCDICGYRKCARALHFHHTDPGGKESEVHVLVKNGWRSTLLEIEKCQLLCANCHFEIEEDKDHKNPSTHSANPNRHSQMRLPWITGSTG